LGRKFPEEITSEKLDELTRAVVGEVSRFGPLTGGVTGIGRMKGNMGDGAAFFVSPNLKGLVALRQLVKRGCERAGFPIQSEYDFVPHITLGYLELDSPLPQFDLDDDIELTLNTFSIKVGKSTHTTITLAGEERLDALRLDEMSTLEESSPYSQYAQEASRVRTERIVNNEGRKFKVIGIPASDHIDRTPMKAQVLESPSSTGEDLLTVYVGPEKDDGKVFRLRKPDGRTCLMVGFASKEMAQEAFRRESSIERNGLISLREPAENRDPLSGISTRRDHKTKAERRTDDGTGDSEEDSHQAIAIRQWIKGTNPRDQRIFPWDDHFPGFLSVYFEPIECSATEIKSLIDFDERLTPFVVRIREFGAIYQEFLVA
jgi:hypothetical protein